LVTVDVAQDPAELEHKGQDADSTEGAVGEKRASA
jgi:hypothetical protein